MKKKIIKKMISSKFRQKNNKNKSIINCKIGKNFKFVEPINIYGSEFGNDVFVGPFVEIQKNVKINDNTKISSHSFICELVSIGKNCFIGHGVMFVNDLFKTGKLGGIKKNWFSTDIKDIYNLDN